MMNSKPLYTLAIIQAFHDEGEDIIDAYWPMVVLTMDSNIRYEIDQLQQGILVAYEIDIPLNSLKTFIKRAINKKYLERDDKFVLLTDKGREYINCCETPKDSERKVNSLVNGARTYLKKTYGYEAEDIQDKLFSFVNESIELFNIIEKGEEYSAYLKPSEYKIFIEYILFIEKHGLDQYKILQEVVCGSVLQLIFKGVDPSEIGRRFDTLHVYLDSNYILSLLGMHHEAETKAANELFLIMRNYKSIKLRVFDITLREIYALLKRFPQERGKYLGTMPVGSIYNAMRRKGYTYTKVLKDIRSMESRLLDEFHISVHNTNNEYEDYAISQREAYALHKYKPNQHDSSQKHDLLVVQLIRNIRGGRKKFIELSSAIFLTSDRGLAKYNIEHHQHYNQSTVGEVILDTMFTNTLWLKNPNRAKNVPVHVLLHMHSRHLMINRAVWKRFYNLISELKDSAELSDDMISCMLYDQNCRDLLIDIHSEDLDIINSDYVIDMAVKCKERFDINSERISSQHKAEILQIQSNAKEQIKSKEDELYKQKVEQIETFNVYIRQEAVRQVSWQIAILRLALFVILSAIAYKSFPMVKSEWDSVEPFVWLITFVLSLALFGFSWVGLGNIVRKFLIDRKLRVLRSNFSIPSDEDHE